MSLSKRLFSLVLLIAVAGFCVGCNGNVHVSGKVTYPNGTPLSTGQIISTDDFHMGRSDINKNGEYSLHTYRRNDGVPRGIYKVYITCACRFEKDPDQREGDLRLDRMVLLIDMQHTNPDTSGWEFELKKSQKIDLIVYPPGEVPDEERTEAARLFFEEGYREKVQKEQRNSGNSSETQKKRRLVNPKLL